ncbi:hypothetical protein N7504_009752 [Penicillium tannophilum]|nr:hypothetical protein N7504_009752 [Penicillium tannophilum]
MHFDIENFYSINLGNDSTALGDIIQIQSCLRQGSYQLILVNSNWPLGRWGGEQFRMPNKLRSHDLKFADWKARQRTEQHDGKNIALRMDLA